MRLDIDTCYGNDLNSLCECSRSLAIGLVASCYGHGRLGGGVTLQVVSRTLAMICD